MNADSDPGWIPIEKRDTAWHLYKEIFVCRVRSFQTMSLDYVQTVGVHSSGDEEIDRGAAMTMVTIGIPISQMMAYFERGVTVAVVKTEDCKRIYEIVHNHLKAWSNIVTNSFNPGKVPVKDLIALDKFASVVYPMAQPFFENENNKKTFATMLSGRKPLINRLPNNEQVAKPAYKSVAGVFKRGGNDTNDTPTHAKRPIGPMRGSALRGGGLRDSLGGGLNE
jgi:hypothetical protein